ncbi:MAG: 5-(carboxyamino)imidazole ribonucleotide synthase [bacterium]|nr:5-(carboxyamino)imidazole ribonucleotide synthase [Deltaproteobacteria bacterium]MCP4907924.1 5-(carboxyamino)imidazole ribonucleotide synthase [bacterium]
MKVGILGGGQLGQMLADAASKLSVETLVLDPKPDAVAGRITRLITADWVDPAALDQLAACDVVTYEFENVPAAAVERLSAVAPVHPSPEALACSGDRIVEKDLFRELGIETAPFVAVDAREDLDRGVEKIGLPAILKTRRFGYDGKGQALLRDATDVDAAWEILGGQALILEGFVPFDREVSVLAARGRDGEMRYWPATENVHVDGILHISRAPAPEVSDALLASAVAGLEAVMARLDYVGVLVVEFFQLGDRLVANEMACRVHNSGHWTIEGASASQFENHMRSVVGLSLAPTETAGFAAMINLVGEIPTLSPLEEKSNIHLHVYGKSSAPGRKLGHVTVVADSREALEERIREVLEVVGDRAAAST